AGGGRDTNSRPTPLLAMTFPAAPAGWKRGPHGRRGSRPLPRPPSASRTRSADVAWARWRRGADRTRRARWRLWPAPGYHGGPSSSPRPLARVLAEPPSIDQLLGNGANRTTLEF